MDARRFLTEIVDPTIRDFEEYPTSQRHAFLACVATFHTVDYLTHPMKSANRRKLFRRESKEFALVDRIAHAFKHVETGHEESDISPLKASDVIERPPAFWGRFAWDLSRWNDTIGGVTIAGEHEHDLLIVVKLAADYLRTQICEDVSQLKTFTSNPDH
jgi:hypothetical protein